MIEKRRPSRASSRITRRGKARRIFGLFLKIGLPVAFLVGLVFLLRANFLQVKDFKISGVETIPLKSIKNVASNFISGNNLFVIPRSNILILNKQKLATALLSQFGRLEKVEINRHFLSESVDLTVTERKEDFLWCSTQDLPAQAGECFFMTRDGLVFEKAVDMGNKIIFRGILEGNPIMKNFATPVKMQNYLKLVEVLKNSGLEIEVINIESNDKAVAKSNVGDIIFNPEEVDPSLVGQNIILLINDVKSKNPSARFDYIDARFGNKVFYKLL